MMSDGFAMITDPTPQAQVLIRDIDGQSELRAVEELQKQVWGLPDLDVVPLTQLVAAKEAGGILIGAFHDQDLVGFVYGFVGHESGQMTHHSHMLAVKPGFRDQHVGSRLKLAQREKALAQGISEMSWTFDPLQGLNAYFNFSRLGVVSNRYLLDFYGTEAASFLHRNGTDRLWVTWHLTSRRVKRRIEGSGAGAGIDDAEPLLRVESDGTPLFQNLKGSAVETAFIDIPGRISEIEITNRELAAAWRAATRKAFTEAMAAGYVVVDFIRNNTAGRYLLLHSNSGSEKITAA